MLKKNHIIWALIPLAILITLLTLNVFYFDDTLSGANQMALILATAIAGIIALFLGIRWQDMQKGILQSIASAMPSILILLMIGALAGTWLISGVVPAMVYYGLKILHPSIFLPVACIICALVSLATGSSWSTVATIGVALLGIGKSLGMSEGVVAGAIISGAYFGDKMSPLSDTTNLAPAMAGTDIFTHIKYMSHTTSVSILITIVIFAVWGLGSHETISANNINEVLNTIDDTFFISPVLFLVPVMLVIIIIKRVPPIPALLAGSLLGAAFAIIFQPHIIDNLSDPTYSYAKSAYLVVLQAMFGGTSIVTSSEMLNELFSTTGMSGMLNTIWLILSAMVFGGMMESAGFLQKIAQAIMRFVFSTGSLIASTVFTCIFFNFTASDQYISIVVPGRMFSPIYKQRNLKPEVLSRTLEDAGTVTSVLIPWNTCGATQSSILGVSTLTYAPFAFFNLLSPLTTIIFGFIGSDIRYQKEEEK